MSVQVQDIAERFAKAVEGRGDPGLADLFAAKVTVGHVYDEQQAEVDGAAMAQMTLQDEPGFRRLMSDYSPGEIRVFCSDQGFTLVRTVRGTLSDGTRITYPFCAVATVESGKIVRIEAYQDRAQAAPLGAAMEALQKQQAVV